MGTVSVMLRSSTSTSEQFLRSRLLPASTHGGPDDERTRSGRLKGIAVGVISERLAASVSLAGGIV